MIELVDAVAVKPVKVIVALATTAVSVPRMISAKNPCTFTLLEDLVVIVPSVEVIPKPVRVMSASPLATTETLPKVEFNPGTPATAEPCAATVPSALVPTRLDKVKLAVPVTLVSVPKAEVIAKLGAFISIVVKAVTLPKADVIPKPETVIVLV